MTFALIGCGKMGSALLSGALVADAVSSENTLVCDSYLPAAESLAEKHSLTVANIETIARSADCILLSTKPGDISQALSVLTEKSTRPQLIISVAAGVTLTSLRKDAPADSRLIRCMPNTPALVGQGASAFAAEDGASSSDIEFVTSFLGSVGQIHQLPESLLDAVTGLSGSGPAYVYLIIEALADGGVKNGLPRDKALSLAAQTVLGAAHMVTSTGQHPALLKDAVTSPGGTTIAGLAELEKGSLRSSLIQAVTTATERSRELGA